VTSVHSQRASTGPTLSEVVDGRRGRVTVSGHLTPQGADLLRGTVEGLRRLGHSTVVLDLKGVRVADPAGLHVLSDLCTSMADSGNRLLLQDVPHETAEER
jgi:anti-anti-sigma regulatory factor